MSRFDGATRGRFATRRIGFHSLLHLCGIAALVGCLTLGCTLSPVVTVPQAETRHSDACEQAAADYCEQVVKADEGDLDACVAKYAFECISGGSK